MEAAAWKNRYTYGIRVGPKNRERFFDRSWDHIEVEMDGQIHRFPITDSFWRKCPEFRDRGTPQIRDWLRGHFRLPWPKGEPPHMELVPLGGNRFRAVS